MDLQRLSGKAFEEILKRGQRPWEGPEREWGRDWRYRYSRKEEVDIEWNAESKGGAVEQERVSDRLGPCRLASHSTLAKGWRSEGAGLFRKATFRERRDFILRS